MMRQIDRNIDRQKYRQIEIYQIEIQIDRNIDRQKERKIDKQIDRKILDRYTQIVGEIARKMFQYCIVDTQTDSKIVNEIILISKFKLTIQFQSLKILKFCL